MSARVMFAAVAALAVAYAAPAAAQGQTTPAPAQGTPQGTAAAYGLTPTFAPPSEIEEPELV